MNIRNHVGGAVILVLDMAGCPSTPTHVDELDSVRAAVQRVESAPDAGKYAANEISAAHDALRDADELVKKGKSHKQIEAAAYVAHRHADIAAEQIARGQAEQRTAQAEA